MEDCELYGCDVENSGVGAVFESRGATLETGHCAQRVKAHRDSPYPK